MATTTVAPKTKTTGGSFLLEDHPLDNVFTPEDFNEDQQMVVKLAEEFATNEIVPVAEKMEHKDWEVSRELLRKAAEMGLTNADIPAEYGGSDMDKVSSAIIADFMAKYGSFMVTLGAHSGIGTLPLVFFGTEEQKKKYLPRLATARDCRRLCALGEHQRLRCDEQPHPRRALARRQALHPQRREDVDHQRRLRRPVHRLRQDRRRKVHRIPGRERFPRLHPSAPKRTRWASAARPPAPLILNDCKVPVENVLGEIGKGHIIAFNILNVGRFKLGAMLRWRRAQLRCENAIAYAKERKAFGKSDRRLRTGAREDRADGGRDLRRRVDGLSHRRHDGRGAVA